MELYTPNDSTYHVATQLPEDLKDYRTAASVRTGIEAALDNAAYLKRLKDGLRIYQTCMGNAGQVAFENLNNTSQTIVKCNGSDVKLSIHDCIADDSMFVMASYGVETISFTTTIHRLTATFPFNGYATIHSLTTKTNSNIVTLAGMLSVPDDGQIDVAIEVENSTSGANVGSRIIGQIMLLAVRIR